VSLHARFLDGLISRLENQNIVDEQLGPARKPESRNPETQEPDYPGCFRVSCSNFVFVSDFEIRIYFFARLCKRSGGGSDHRVGVEVGELHRGTGDGLEPSLQNGRVRLQTGQTT
jgi:hypothetical protein